MTTPFTSAVKVSLFASMVLVCSLAGCERARASPGGDDGDSRLEAALGEHDAQLAGTPARPVRASGPECPAGSLIYDHGASVVFCAALCSTDTDCALDERCRVLDATRPRDVVFADDVRGDKATDEIRAGGSPGPVFVRDKCTEECPSSPLMYEVKAAKPTAVCDPFHAAGVLALPEEEAALAARTTVGDEALLER